ncbi:carboxypeptidase B-like, partial [Saccoglossus kowalevskii]|uniref:Carboxypeptidase A2-like n=1 Tax=Saccoglossus kowalevskii TaxID=10224 RepID=A0ABM0GXG1_SACKO
IDQWVNDTAARYPTLAKEFVIGSSYENRVMRALKVGSESSEVKPAMWVHSGIHAREWVTPATNTWMTNQLLVDYSTNDLVRTLLDTFDFYILPITNPDGYEYTWTDDRMWRKTRSVNDDSTCIGVDPNRNWAYEWGGSGASKFPCFDTYRGPYPHSEVEVRNVADFILERAKTQEFVFFMDIHSYSQMWLNPWGYTEEYPEDYEDHMKVGEIFTEAVASVHGQQYTYGTIPDLLYVSSGCSVDWGHGIMGIKYSHTTELRDTGEYSFLLPEDQIIPTAQETYAGFVAVYEHIMNKRVSSNIQNQLHCNARRQYIRRCCDGVATYFYSTLDQLQEEATPFAKMYVTLFRILALGPMMYFVSVTEATPLVHSALRRQSMCGQNVNFCQQVVDDNDWSVEVQSLRNRYAFRHNKTPQGTSSGILKYNVDRDCYERMNKVNQVWVHQCELVELLPWVARIAIDENGRTQNMRHEVLSLIAPINNTVNLIHNFVTSMVSCGEYEPHNSCRHSIELADPQFCVWNNTIADERNTDVYYSVLEDLSKSATVMQTVFQRFRKADRTC